MPSRGAGTGLVLLSTDLILVAGLGCLLITYQGGPDTRLAFLAAFIVANLVAMVGHSMATGCWAAWPARWCSA